MDSSENRRFLELSPFLERLQASVPLPLLALVRWSQAAGARDYLCFQNFDSLRHFCLAVPVSTNVIVFTDLGGSLAGVCGPELVSRALMTDGRQDWLVVNWDEAPDWTPHARNRRPRLSPLESRQQLRSLVPTHMACQYEHELREAAGDLAGNQVRIFTPLPHWASDPFLDLVVEGEVGTY